MKQKLFTLLTLLVLCVTGASAADDAVTLPGACLDLTSASLSTNLSGISWITSNSTSHGYYLSDDGSYVTFYGYGIAGTDGVTWKSSNNNISQTGNAKAWSASRYYQASTYWCSKSDKVRMLILKSTNSNVSLRVKGTTAVYAKVINSSTTSYVTMEAYTVSADVLSLTPVKTTTSVTGTTDLQDISIKGLSYDTEYVIYLHASNTSGNSGLYEIAFTPSVPVAFAAGKTMVSFSDANNALDLTTAKLPDGLAAYKVTAANATSVTLTPVDAVVASNTGLILTGTAGKDYDILVKAAGDATDISGTNKLVATDGTSTVENAAVLSGGEFHPLNSGIIAAGKAYLPYAKIDGGNPFGGGAHALEIVFGNETTAIKAVEAKKVENGVFYNLAGQQVAQPTKGLYIVNGKKVLVP